MQIAAGSGELVYLVYLVYFVYLVDFVLDKGRSYQINGTDQIDEIDETDQQTS